MKNLYKLITGLAVALSILMLPFGAQAQTRQWTSLKSAGSTGIDNAVDMVTDANGDIYVVGSYESTISFGSIQLTNSGNLDGFIAKLGKDGNWKWARKIGGTGADAVNGVDVDQNGNVYIVGSFTSSTTIYLTTGNLTLTSAAGNTDLFHVEFNSLGGALTYGKGGLSEDFAGEDIKVSDDGEVYISGSYVDGSTGVLYGYLARLSVNGYSSFLSEVESTTLADCSHLALTGNRIFVSGVYSSDITMDGVSLYGIGGTEGFVLEYDYYGNFLRGISLRSTNNDYVLGLDADGDNVIATGAFSGSMSILGTTIDGNNGGYDMFFANLNFPSSSTYITLNWARAFGGPGSDIPYGVRMDYLGDIYATGQYAGTVYLGSTTNLTSTGREDVFLMKLSGSDATVSGAYSGGANNTLYINGMPVGDVGVAVDLDDDNNVVVYGRYTDQAAFGSLNTSSSGSTELFVATLAEYNLDIDYTGSNRCMGEDFDVNIVSSPQLNSGNTYSVELSDMNGSFASPTVVGTANATGNTTVHVTLPASITAGFAYRLRVKASDPALTSTGGNTFSIGAQPAKPSIVGPDAVDKFTTHTYSVGATAGSSYTWIVQNGNQVSGGNTNSITVQWGSQASGTIKVVETAAGGCMSDTATYNVTINTGGGVGITEGSEINGLELFPNPAQDKLTVKLQLRQANAVSIKVKNILGQTVKSADAATQQSACTETIDLSSLAPGTYMLEVRAGNEISVKKFSKQ